MSGRVAHKPEISSSLAGAEDIGTLIVRHPLFYGLAVALNLDLYSSCGGSIVI